MFDKYFDYEDLDVISWDQWQYYNCRSIKSFQVQGQYVNQGDEFGLIVFSFDTGIMNFYRDSESENPDFSVQFQLIPQGLVNTNEQT